MAKHSFVGGIHPNDGKDLSKNRAILEYKPKGKYDTLIAMMSK